LKKGTAKTGTLSNPLTARNEEESITRQVLLCSGKSFRGKDIRLSNEEVEDFACFAAHRLELITNKIATDGPRFI
jgi:hypothetical protein